MHQVRCPSCNKRVIDTIDPLKLKVERMSDRTYMSPLPDMIQKCPHCKQQIAFYFTK